MLVRILTCIFVFSIPKMAVAQSTLDLELRRQLEDANGDFNVETRKESWQPTKTALIVCDTWDYHHCLNAVRRLEEFAPRLNGVVKNARERGITIIHAPSDCMKAYADHPARKRAIDAPKAAYQPYGIGSWCSVIPAEERAVYPIDQSDGGEDDDPKEHAEWAAKLKEMGRNPATPWLKQVDSIAIDADSDYITDRGNEVWNILESKGISNVILAGVHTNMCVLGRPFGLRQMVRNGKNTVLLRDMTDTMYNPKRWPFVNHFEGTRRIISHIEKFVCPTISSDQLIGGEEFRFKDDDGDSTSNANPNPQWEPIQVDKDKGGLGGHGQGVGGAVTWYRCVLHLPEAWIDSSLRIAFDEKIANVWCNGTPLEKSDANTFVFDEILADDFNLLVVQDYGPKLMPPTVRSGDQSIMLAGKWQVRGGQPNDQSLVNIPLPAKFGGSSDIVFSPPEPMWTPRPLTRKGQFTLGIEGPACDHAGNIYAVNFERQGTIGRIRPDGVGEVFVQLPEGSIGNGIRFDRDGAFFYVADYTKHNILKVNVRTRQITVHAHNDRMNQPNDLAIADDGTLYASDPNWKEATGQLWRIDTDGTTTRLAENMGTTNGIEVSPDGKTLYVNESKQRKLWAFDITDEKTVTGKRLLKEFPDHGFDGMRCDVDGNLYLTRYGKGVVAKVTPQGKILREIPVLGARPSNLCFGGPDGRTVFVTEVESTRIVSFRVDRPGRSWRP